ncbi:MAG: CrcB family protein [Dermatophilus congolensis]|nr:CrcB family protein [Dermatophilus congolensis]
MLAAVSAGGAVGAGARWSLGQAWPVHADAFPWSTLAINVAGCFAIGVLMVVVTRRSTHLPYLRPFLGVGVLGGFTTFSTFALEAFELTAAGLHVTAAAYLLLTPALAVGAALLGTRVTSAALAGEAA